MTLMETLVKTELERQSGKVWEREVIVKNGVEEVAYIVKTDSFSPCFYMRDLEYSVMNNNKSLSVFQYIHDFLAAANSNKDTIEQIKKDVQDYEKIKEQLDIRIVEQKVACGKELECGLYAIPYVKFQDGEANMAANVSESLLKIWNKTFDEVYECAQNNAKKNVRIIPMKQIMLEVMIRESGNHITEEEIEGMKNYLDLISPDEFMYVLTNQSKHLGASAIIYDDVLNEAAKILKTEKIIILPSSIHEVIAIPYSEDKERFIEMVKEVNGTEVDPKDRLTDAILVWDGKKLIKEK